MVKKITIGMMFLIIVSTNGYSQTLATYEFELIENNAPRDKFVELGSIFGNGFANDEGFHRIEILPNSVQNEINRRLADYRPLNNGQIFYWRGSIQTSRVSGTVYMVLLRITDARNSQWEYFAYRRILSIN